MQPILVHVGEMLKKSCQCFKRESLLLQGNREPPTVSQVLEQRQIPLQQAGTMTLSSLGQCEGGEENRFSVPKDGVEAVTESC